MAVANETRGGGIRPSWDLIDIVDFAAQSHVRAVAVLLVVTLLNLLPGFFAVPPIDRDEPRYAQASKQMIESGDYIDIRFQDTARHIKPVGIYWLQAGVVNVARALGASHALTTIWLYRVPSLIGAIGGVLLTYWAALAFLTSRGAFLAALMMASSVLLGLEARLATTDATLLATIVAAMGVLARAYLPTQRESFDGRGGWILPGVFWTALAAGVLIKGPIILMIVGLAVATLSIVERSARWLLLLRPLAGLAWAALLVLPWPLAFILHVGGGMDIQSILHDSLGKVAEGQQSHWAPPGSYALLFFLSFGPAAALVAMAAPAVWAARRQHGTTFLLAWLVPSWVVFELVATKLPNYVLPLYPAIAILIARMMEARLLSNRPWLVRGTALWFVIPLIVGIIGIVVLLTIGHRFGVLVWATVGVCLVIAWSAWRRYRDEGPERALVRAVVASILMSAAIYGLVIPALSQLFPSVALARIIRDSGCAEPLVATAGFHEPSLVFLVGTMTRHVDGAPAADFLRGGECRFAFIQTNHMRAFAQRAEAIGLRYSAGPQVDLINPNAQNKVATISVYRSVGAP